MFPHIRYYSYLNKHQLCLMHNESFLWDFSIKGKETHKKLHVLENQIFKIFPVWHSISYQTEGINSVIPLYYHDKIKNYQMVVMIYLKKITGLDI